MIAENYIPTDKAFETFDEMIEKNYAPDASTIDE